MRYTAPSRVTRFLRRTSSEGKLNSSLFLSISLFPFFSSFIFFSPSLLLSHCLFPYLFLFLSTFLFTSVSLYLSLSVFSSLLTISHLSHTLSSLTLFKFLFLSPSFLLFLLYTQKEKKSRREVVSDHTERD